MSALDPLMDLALVMGRGGASEGAALGVLIVGCTDDAGPKLGLEGLISGDGSRPRYMGRFVDRRRACERVTRGVEDADWDEAKVAGEETDALSTTVTSSHVDAIIARDAFFALADITTREGVDPDPAESTPREPEWECAAANALITPGSISRAEKSARLTGLSCAGLPSSWSSSTRPKRRLAGVVRAWFGERSPSAKRTRRFDGLSQPSGPVRLVDEDGAGLRARLSVDDGVLPLGVAPFEPPSIKGSRASSSRGNRALCDVSIVSAVHC